MKNIFKSLKESRFTILFTATIITLFVFVLSLIAVILYGANCASEYNGNKVSANVIGLGVTTIILSGVALLVDIVALFLIENKKIAYAFSFVRILNYLAFVFGIGAFLFQILDEYSLLGTILYPIVQGAVGDPVDPVLSGYYFTSLILLLHAVVASLVTGIILRKKSHKILKVETPKEEISSDKEVKENE